MWFLPGTLGLPEHSLKRFSLKVFPDGLPIERSSRKQAQECAAAHPKVPGQPFWMWGRPHCATSTWNWRLHSFQPIVFPEPDLASDTQQALNIQRMREKRKSGLRIAISNTYSILAAQQFTVYKALSLILSHPILRTHCDAIKTDSHSFHKNWISEKSGDMLKVTQLVKGSYRIRSTSSGSKCRCSLYFPHCWGSEMCPP